MAMFIILSASQADYVRGPSASTPSAALAPVERAGSVFILNADVLDDPAHAAHHDYLAALPQIDITDPSFPAEIE